MAKDWIEIQAQPLSVERAWAFLNDGSAGGTAFFLGTTRAARNEQGRELLALIYEAYAEMAAKQLADFARRARERWPVVKLVLLHRMGRVEVGEPSVLVGVSTPHRGDAFEACRWLIDTLKADAAIWKQEVWQDAPPTWVHPAGDGE